MKVQTKNKRIQKDPYMRIMLRKAEGNTSGMRKAIVYRDALENYRNYKDNFL